MDELVDKIFRNGSLNDIKILLKNKSVDKLLEIINKLPTSADVKST